MLLIAMTLLTLSCVAKQPSQLEAEASQCVGGTICARGSRTSSQTRQRKKSFRGDKPAAYTPAQTILVFTLVTITFVS